MTTNGFAVTPLERVAFTVWHGGGENGDPEATGMLPPTNRRRTRATRLLVPVDLTITLVRPPRRARSWFLPCRRKIRGVLRKFEFAGREVAVAARVDLPPASIRRHRTQGPNHILHFRARWRKLARRRVCRPVVAHGAASCNGPVIGSRRRVSRVPDRHRVRARNAQPRGRARLLCRGVILIIVIARAVSIRVG